MKQLSYRLALLTTVASMFFVNANLFASETDDRIESSAKQSYVFKTYDCLADDSMRSSVKQS